MSSSSPAPTSVVPAVPDLASSPAGVVDQFRRTQSDSYWREKLSAEEYHILREAGTEEKSTGEYNKHYPKSGYYVCRGCGLPLYSFAAKFDSGCGWPAFNRCYASKLRLTYRGNGKEKDSNFQEKDSSLQEKDSSNSTKTTDKEHQENINSEVENKLQNNKLQSHVYTKSDSSTGELRVEISCTGCDGHLGHVFFDEGKTVDERHCVNSVSVKYVEGDVKEAFGGGVSELGDHLGEGNVDDFHSLRSDVSDDLVNNSIKREVLEQEG